MGLIFEEQSNTNVQSYHPSTFYRQVPWNNPIDP